MGQSVNYFANLEAKCLFPKLECSESSFPKRMVCQYNLISGERERENKRRTRLKASKLQTN
jgi:hypothetical protein